MVRRSCAALLARLGPCKLLGESTRERTKGAGRLKTRKTARKGNFQCGWSSGVSSESGGNNRDLAALPCVRVRLNRLPPGWPLFDPRQQLPSRRAPSMRLRRSDRPTGISHEASRSGSPGQKFPARCGGAQIPSGTQVKWVSRFACAGKLHGKGGGEGQDNKDTNRSRSRRCFFHSVTYCTPFRSRGWETTSFSELIGVTKPHMSFIEN